MSTHEIPVVRITEILKHENADTLAITKVFGWTCCIGKDQFKVGDLAVYIPPDYICPTDRPEFAFLAKEGKTESRIKVKKLRGVISQGLILKAPDCFNEGDNAMEYYGIKRYEPPLGLQFETDNVPDPAGLFAPKYDVESLNRYIELFTPGEDVVATEKIHGASARFTFTNGIYYVGSRTNWKAENVKSPWWVASKLNPWIEEWCRNHPDYILYGEIFGQVQELKYGAARDQINFAVFDILYKNDWLSYDECQAIGEGLTFVPFVYRGPFDLPKLQAFAEENSRWPAAKDQLSEGVVIKPVVERTSLEIGRVKLKLVSNRYMMS